MASSSSSSCGVNIIFDTLTQPLKMELNDLKAKLRTYNEQRSQVQELLAVDPTNERVLKLREDIQTAIATTEQLVNEKWADIKKFEETRYVVDAICEAKYEDGGWYAARIEDVFPKADENDTRRYFVSFIGYPNTAECTLHQLRPFRPPPIERLAMGSTCKAVSSSTGQFMDAIIENPTDHHTVWVYATPIYIIINCPSWLTFKGQNVSEEVPITHVRVPNTRLHSEMTSSGTGAVPAVVVPKAAALSGSVSAAVTTKKQQQELAREKKKQKLEKNQKRIAELEEERRQSQQQWQSFSNKLANKGKKAGIFNFGRNRESQFKSPDNVDGKVGIINSGKGMSTESSFVPLPRGSAGNAPF